MTWISVRLLPLLLLLSLAPVASTQSAAPPISRAPQITAVPNMLKFNGTARDGRGEDLSGVLGMTFALYATEEGGNALWRETQNVTADRNGQYAAALGLTSAEGIPTELFTSGEARWLSVQIDGHPEERRVLLLSVPYALKAKDAETVGGQPATNFVTQQQLSATALAANAVTPFATPTGTGTTGALAMWTSSSVLGNSGITQLGTGSSARIGIKTATPASSLDINGNATLRGSLSMIPNLSATSSAGVNSPEIGLTASSFRAGRAASNESFVWQATSIGNNTATPSAKLSLLFAPGTAAPTPTGLSIAANGRITFAPGQSIPGAGVSTITGVTAGTALTGGGASGNVTLNLDTTKVPLLDAGNAFTQPQTIVGGIGGLTVTSTGIAVYGIGNVGIYGTTSVPGGNSNGVLGNSFNATAVRGNDTGGGSGVVGTSSTGYGVYGRSSSGIAVYGSGGAGSGIPIGTSAVVGDSSSANGVTGISFDGAGVIAINRKGNSGLASVNQGSGFGLYSTAATIDKDYGVAIRGESYGTQASSFGGSDGVQGITHTVNGSGVTGINDAFGGIGVYGSSTNSGFGFETPSNVQQARGMGGWVKAMAFVDPFVQGGIAITRCFNSQASGAAVYTPPCGMTVTHQGQGVNIIDFGFAVNDRYIHVDSTLDYTESSAGSVDFFPTFTLATTDSFTTGPFPFNANQALFYTAYLPGAAGVNAGDVSDNRFIVIVY